MPIEKILVRRDDGIEALEIIKHYVNHKKEYPEYYFRFFIEWGMINSLYNACSNSSHEAFRVVDFGKKSESLCWNYGSIKDNTRELVSCECVGNGKSFELPNEYVRAATLYLRNELHIDSGSVCANCKKNELCNKIKWNSISDFNNYKFAATMRILYQIRCNLFHGDKPELEGDQGERNKKLVENGDRILTDILHVLQSEKIPEKLAER